ncbi:hypothetical protein [Halocatena marina]|uniref:hypothetical protein n=1 Tax=Halocatena marina TaxID=2934937 RepID=UPI00200D193F|nr:hypothetical protein [Halocatena marina]
MAYNTGTLTVFDSIASELMLPLASFLVTVIVGWIYSQETVTELRHGIRSYQ